MRIATFNINGIGSRLPALLQWLEETQPDVACLQELKAPQEKFPEQALLDIGYHAIWQGQKSWNGVAILARGVEPQEVQRGLPGDETDEQSRYLEAAVNGVLVACLYLPNGNPAPGPKFDYKLAWMERFIERAAGLYASGAPVVLAGDYNVIPTDNDVYKPERWQTDALFRPDLHVLGLFPQGVRPRRRPAHRSPAAQPSCRQRVDGSAGRPRRARAREAKRPCTDVDRTGYGQGAQLSQGQHEGDISVSRITTKSRCRVVVFDGHLL
jgi:endonuclease/exonuclease/phosphatase family metal-dependent hydrolase